MTQFGSNPDLETIYKMFKYIDIKSVGTTLNDVPILLQKISPTCKIPLQLKILVTDTNKHPLEYFIESNLLSNKRDIVRINTMTMKDADIDLDILYKQLKIIVTLKITYTNPLDQLKHQLVLSTTLKIFNRAYWQALKLV